MIREAIGNVVFPIIEKVFIGERRVLEIVTSPDFNMYR
jgi:hypothetical protein